MKRAAFALCILAIAIALLVWFPTLASPPRIPHEDPAIAKETPDMASVLLFYSNVFDLASLSKYRDASSLLKELEHANIPQELRFIVEQYSSLCQELFTALDNLEQQLNEASSLLSQLHVSDARQKLDAAAKTLPHIQSLLQDIEAATKTFSNRLGALTALPGSSIQLAFSRLQESLTRLNQLIEKLNQLQQELNASYETEIATRIPTELNLEITPASAFVGEGITASGRLAAIEPLATRQVTLYLNDESHNVTTDSSGNYNATINLPFKYVSIMNINAVYTPSGPDTTAYLGSRSQTIAVESNFFATQLEIAAPGTACPGLPITVSGKVTPTTQRTIRLYLDNTLLAQTEIEDESSFSFSIVPKTPVGKHNLTLVALPRGRYAGATRSQSLDISQLPTRAEMELSRFVVSPGRIQVSGKLQHNLEPVKEASVNLAFMNSSKTVETAADGSFSATLEAPFDLLSVGPKEITIAISPTQPWYAPLQIKRTVFVINSANIVIMLAILLSLGLLVFNKVRMRPSAQQEKALSPAGLPAQVPAFKDFHARELPGNKTRVISAYQIGVAAVEKATGILITPNITLRELLNSAKAKLPSATSFSELTLLAEVALYSGREIGADMVARAENLATLTQRESR